MTRARAIFFADSSFGVVTYTMELLPGSYVDVLALDMAANWNRCDVSNPVAAVAVSKSVLLQADVIKADCVTMFNMGSISLF